MSYQLTFQGANATQNITGLVETNIAGNNVTITSNPGYAFLTGVLYNAADVAQNVPLSINGQVSSITNPGQVSGRIVLTTAEKNELTALGVLPGANNLQLTWLPINKTVTATLTGACTTQSGAVILSIDNFRSLIEAGFVQNSSLTLTWNGNTYTGSWNSNALQYSPPSPTIVPTSIHPLTITQDISTFAGANNGTWTNGSWDGDLNVNFTCGDMIFASPLILNQPFTLTQTIGSGFGSYQAWLYDNTGLARNAIQVSGQLDLDQNNQNNVFNPPPIISLRVDSTYGTDTNSGQPLLPYQLTNQAPTYNVSYVTTQPYTVNFDGVNYTLALNPIDYQAMLVAGFIPQCRLDIHAASGGGEITGTFGYTNVVNAYVHALHFEHNFIHDLDGPPSHTFAGALTITSIVTPNPSQIVLALDPVRYATGKIVISYSGTIDELPNIQLITDSGTANSFVWPPTDETLEDASTTSAFEVSLEGHGRSLMTIPFSINYVAPVVDTMSLSLNGTSQWVDVGPGPNSIFQCGHAWTMSAWVYTADNDNYTILANQAPQIGGGIGTGTSINTFLAYNTPLLVILGSTLSNVQYTSAYETALTIPPNTWTNVIVSYSAATNTYTDFSCYINGVSAVSYNNDSGQGPAYGAPTANTLIGSSNGGEGNIYPFAGNISNVALWNRVLTPAEVTAVYNNGTLTNLQALSSASALVSWWQLNGDCTDTLGVNNGTPIGSPTFSVNIP